MNGTYFASGLFNLSFDSEPDDIYDSPRIGDRISFQESVSPTTHSDNTLTSRNLSIHIPQQRRDGSVSDFSPFSEEFGNNNTNTPTAEQKPSFLSSIISFATSLLLPDVLGDNSITLEDSHDTQPTPQATPPSTVTGFSSGELPISSSPKSDAEITPNPATPISERPTITIPPEDESPTIATSLSIKEPAQTSTPKQEELSPFEQVAATSSTSPLSSSFDDVTDTMATQPSTPSISSSSPKTPPPPGTPKATTPISVLTTQEKESGIMQQICDFFTAIFYCIFCCMCNFNQTEKE